MTRILFALKLLTIVLLVWMTYFLGQIDAKLDEAQRDLGTTQRYLDHIERTLDNTKRTLDEIDEKFTGDHQ